MIDRELISRGIFQGRIAHKDSPEAQDFENQERVHALLDSLSLLDSKVFPTISYAGDDIHIRGIRSGEYRDSQRESLDKLLDKEFPVEGKTWRTAQKSTEEITAKAFDKNSPVVQKNRLEKTVRNIMDTLSGSDNGYYSVNKVSVIADEKDINEVVIGLRSIGTLHQDEVFQKVMKRAVSVLRDNGFDENWSVVNEVISDSCITLRK